MTPCPYCDQASVVDDEGHCIHCGADRGDLVVTITVTIPADVLKVYRELDDGEPDLTAEGLAERFVENGVDNAFDLGREEGILP